MRLYTLFVILFFGYASGNLISNVHVVDFAAYMIDVISTTVKQIEQKSWSNLKVPDVSLDIDEVVLGWQAKGVIHYKNGFVNSIQAVDIRRDTVVSFISLNSEQQAQAIIRGTLRMHDVALGYDVEAVFESGTHRYTASYVYPLINFVFSITRIIDSNDYTLTVVGNVPVSRNLPSFLPKSKESDVFTTLFDPNMSVAAINAWGPDIFMPIVEEIVTTKIKFPDICYNCAA